MVSSHGHYGAGVQSFVVLVNKFEVDFVILHYQVVVVIIVILRLNEWKKDRVMESVCVSFYFNTPCFHIVFKSIRKYSKFALKPSSKKGLFPVRGRVKVFIRDTSYLDGFFFFFFF